MPSGNSVNWAEQAEIMAKAWTETQKTVWASWFDWLQAAPAPPTFQGMVEQWRKLGMPGFEAWSTGAAPTVQSMAQQVVTIQEASLRLLQFLANAWQIIAAKVEVGEAWPQALDDYLDQLRQTMSPAGLGRMAHETEELWELYLQQWQKVSQPWLTSLQQTPGPISQAAAGNGSALIELAQLYRYAFDRTFGRLLDSPGMGYTRELNEKLLTGFQAWRELRQASFEYQVVMADAWIQAVEQMMKELAGLNEKGEAIRSVRELVAFWTKVADPVFEQVFRSEKYVRIQGQLLNAAMTYRLHEREIMGQFLKFNDLPTRSEVDEAHRHIYQQRKEIKALKKTLAEADLPGRNEWAEAQRTIAELRQEVQTLRLALADLSASRQTRSDKSTRRKRTGETDMSDDDKGGQGATISNTDHS